MPIPGVRESIEIHADRAAVWRVLTTPEMLRTWMNGADVQSDWQVGSDITIDWSSHGLAFHDRGTVIDAEPGRLLRYSHWTELSRRPDSPAARTTVTLELEAVGSVTVLTASHHNARGSSDKHAHLFWPVALEVIRDLAEGRWNPRISIARDG